MKSLDQITHKVYVVDPNGGPAVPRNVIFPEELQEIEKEVNSDIESLPFHAREIYHRASERYKELNHKGWEWRSFYNGWLECFSDCVPYLKGLMHKEMAKKLSERKRVHDLQEERDRAIEAMEYYIKYKGDLEANPDIAIREFISSLKEKI